VQALQDPAVTDIACAALNGLKMGDKTLTVRRGTERLVFLVKWAKICLEFTLSFLMHASKFMLLFYATFLHACTAMVL